MSNPAMIPAERALRFLNVSQVEVGQLYTVNALGTINARYMRRHHAATHTIGFRDGGEVVHVTVEPWGNDLGQPTYARVIAVSREPAEDEVEDEDFEWAVVA